MVTTSPLILCIDHIQFLTGLIKPFHYEIDFLCINGVTDENCVTF